MDSVYCEISDTHSLRLVYTVIVSVTKVGIYHNWINFMFSTIYVRNL